MKKIKAIGMSGVVIAAGLAGAGIHDALTEPDTVTVEKQVAVPGPVRVVEVNNTVTETKYVEVPDEEAQEKLTILESAYERLTDEELDYDELVLEDAAIESAQAEFEKRIRDLLDLQHDEEVKVIKYFDEEASVSEAGRIIDGKEKEVLISEADFKVRVEISDNDSSSLHEFQVEYELDYESDGDEDESFDVTLL